MNVRLPSLLTALAITSLAARVQPALAADVCYATHNDGATVFSSADAQAVRDAIIAAGTGGTVKVAGYCAGVVTAGGTPQIALITLPITLAGGYSTTDWTTSDPLAHPTILDAQGGGQVIHTTAALTMRDLTVQNGQTTGTGGGIYAGGDLTLVDSIIRQNHSESFGGGFWTSGKLAFSHTQVLNNTAGQVGNGAGAGGVAVGSATLTGGLFQNNISLGGTGGLYANNGANVKDTRFINNRANAGGAGALYLPVSGNSQIVNALFVGNGSSGPGTAMQISTIDNVLIINTTITGPSPGHPVAVDVSKGTTTITNSIIANVPTGIRQISPATVDQNYNLFFGNTANTEGTVGGGTGSLYGSDPRFVDAANGDFRLRSGSPAINAGTNTGCPATDQQGVIRPQELICDIGAYEWVNPLGGAWNNTWLILRQP